jgi:hypothetical protein
MTELASTRETVLRALEALLRQELAGGLMLPPAPLFQRDQEGPDRIPPGGLVILRDGDPGEPEVMMSPLVYIYDHQAEIDVLVTGPAGERQRRFDVICAAIGQAIEADRTLGGLCDWVQGRAPQPAAIADTGGDEIKAATIGVVLTYGSPSPLY